MPENEMLNCMGTERKCIGDKCELFLKFYKLDDKGNKIEFWRCAFVQTPLLIIELIQTILKKGGAS